MFFVKRKSGKIVMRSEGRPTVDEDLFDIYEYDPTEEELEQLEQNYDATWDGKTITLEKNVIQKAEDEAELKKQQIETVKSELAGDPTVTDLKDKILELCDLI